MYYGTVVLVMTHHQQAVTLSTLLSRTINSIAMAVMSSLREIRPGHERKKIARRTVHDLEAVHGHLIFQLQYHLVLKR